MKQMEKANLSPKYRSIKLEADLAVVHQNNENI